MSRNTRPYKSVWISTPPRTGSTWLFNVTREILRAAGRTVLPERVPQEDQQMFAMAKREAWVDTDPARVWVLKIHSTILRADLPQSRIITSIRDPRDVLVSFRQFMDTTFEHALAVCEGVMRYPEGYRDHPPELLLRVDYGDIENRPEFVVGQVAKFLDAPLPPGAEVQIAGRLSRKQVKQLIDDTTQRVFGRLEARAPVARDEVIVREERVARAFDVATAFQTGHVSDNQTGDWRKLLSEDEKALVKARFGDWFERHGFPA